MGRIIKPPRLRKGDVIGLVAPSSPVPTAARIQSGVRYLEGLGYRVKVGRHVGRQDGYLAGTDAERLEDLNGMLRDRAVRAVFALRGGYGASRLLPGVDYAVVRRQPKILVGYSDITALQLAVLRKTGLVSFSGPLVAVEFAEGPDPHTEERFWQMITCRGRPSAVEVAGGNRVGARGSGVATGRLAGGNLSLVTAALGTPFGPDYRESILFLEEVGEALHRVDRMLTHLRNAGVLARIAGLVLGEFAECRPLRSGAPHLNLAQIFAQVAEWSRVPVLRGVPYGHVRRKATLPLGVAARLDARAGRLEFLESGVS